MGIWFKEFSLEQINRSSGDTLAECIGIEVIEIGDDFLRGRMPVDRRTRQPFGILHGGASVALSETLASIGAQCTVDVTRFRCVGLEINANHVRSVRDGFVVGTARALHLGRRTHVWETRIVDEKDRLTCISRITMAVLNLAEGNPA